MIDVHRAVLDSDLTSHRSPAQVRELSFSEGEVGDVAHRQIGDALGRVSIISVKAKLIRVLNRQVVQDRMGVRAEETTCVEHLTVPVPTRTRGLPVVVRATDRRVPDHQWLKTAVRGIAVDASPVS